MGPEKRLPLALFITFLVLFGLQIFFAEDKVSEEDRAKRAAQREDAKEQVDAALGAVDTATDPAVDLPEVEPWKDFMVFGNRGEYGYMRVDFDSLGGSVSEIRLGNYFTAPGLTEEEKKDHGNWVRLAAAVTEKIEAPNGQDVYRTYQPFMLRSEPGEPGRTLTLDPAAVHWRAEPLEDGVRFTHADPSGITMVKTIRAVPGENHLAVDIALTSEDSARVGSMERMWLVASVGMRAEGDGNQYPEPRAVAAREGRDPKDSAIDERGRDPVVQVLKADDIAYFGTHNKYFAMLLRPASEGAGAAMAEVQKLALWDGAWVAQDLEERRGRGFRDLLVEADVRLPVRADAASSTRSFIAYAGPKDADHFSEGDEAFKRIMREDLGFFDGIASVILGYLRFLHGIIGNWGWAIILLTITVRLLLFPLQRKMQTSMARHATKMKRVQPKIDAVKEKYKDDPKKLREEQARLFQTEGAMPPIGGCLPIFLQIPIFFGLFSALRVAFDLRHEPFMGWINDLSQPDRLFATGLDWDPPLIGSLAYFNLLPILMVVLWIGQQKVMPKPATMNEQQAQMQKIMMWMPVMFGVFLYSYAAGLSLYMITTSLFGIIEATVIRKVWPIDDKEQPKKKSRFMEKLSQLQEQALEMQEQQRRMQQKKGGGKGPRGRGGSGGSRKRR